MSEDAAFIRELYAARYRRLVGQLVGVAGDVATAEAVVQEAFVSAVQQPRAFRRLDDPEIWLRSVAVAAARSRWRRTSLRRAAASGPATTRGPAGELSADHLAILGSLRRLPPVQRDVVALHDLAGLGVEQVAQTLGVPTRAVGARLSRGQKSLRSLLADPLPGRATAYRRKAQVAPTDLRALRISSHVEAVVRPPPFDQLLRRAQAGRRRRRTRRAGLLALVVVAAGATVVALERGPDLAVVPVPPPVTSTPVPDASRTRASAPPPSAPQSPSAAPTSRPPASLRAAPIIASSTRLTTLRADAGGFLLEVFAGCPDVTTCESAWRLADPGGAQVTAGTLTGGYTIVTPYPGGFLVTDPASGFGVSDQGRVTPLGAAVPSVPVLAGDVVLRNGTEVPNVFRPRDGSVFALGVATQPARPAVWNSATIDERGWIWVLGGGRDGPSTTLFHSPDQGRTWQARDIGPGIPGELVISGDTIHVVTAGECTVQCIVAGSTSLDRGVSWTSWPKVSNRYLYDLAPGPGDRLFMRTGDTTSAAASRQVLVLARPATGMVDLPAWRPTAPSPDVGLLTSAGATVWFARDASTLMRSTDDGTSWQDVAAR